MMHTALRALAAASLATLSLNVSAATNPTGPSTSGSSNGDFDITLTVEEQIIVTNFDDMDLFTNTATLGQPIEGYENICVGGIGFANYGVNLSSDNGSTGGAGATPFQLNGSTQNLEYTASFINNTSSTSGTSADASGDISGSFPRASTVACATDNARVIVAVAAADWESATEASYTDTLTVTVTAL
jgi:hypothetical protein